MKKVKKEKNIFLVLILYGILVFPFLNITPYLDGNIDFVKSYDFFKGGFESLFNNWGSVHPPLKESINYLLFTFFGTNPVSYNLPWLIFGFLGVFFFYLLSKRVLGEKGAVIGSLLLASSPLFISVGLFSLTDFLLTVFIISSFYFYASENPLWLTVFLSLAVLTKENALLLVISVLLIDTVFLLKSFVNKEKPEFNLKKLIPVAIPLLAYFVWFLFIKAHGKDVWSDWNFSDVAKRGTVYTIIHNVYTFQFLNAYAYQNWRQLFILNFNWVYWLVFISGVTFYLIKKPGSLFKNWKNDNNGKTVAAMAVFCLFYIFLALTFQTFTIPRYALPLYPFLYLGTAWALSLLKGIIRNICLAFLSLLTIAVLFFSIDPVSESIWGKEEVLGQQIYGVKNFLDGNDGITYNMQYLLIAKKRDDMIKGVYKQIDLRRDCYWLFLDPRNDIKTQQILSLNTDIFYACNIVN